MASYTPPTIANYNDNPAPDDGTEVEDNEITWQKIKEELTDPTRVYADDINSAVTTSMAAIPLPSKFVNNSNGNPNFSDQVKDLASLGSSGVWTTIGPTGSSIAWNALNTVPAGADWVEMKIIGTISITAALVTGQLYARSGTESVTGSQLIWTGTISDGTSNAKIHTSMSTAKVPIDTTTREFDIYWLVTSTATAVYNAYLTGYGYNS